MADYGQVLLMRRQEVQEDYEGQGREVQGLEEGVGRGITTHEDVVQGGRQSACGDCPLTSQGQGYDLSSHECHTSATACATRVPHVCHTSATGNFYMKLHFHTPGGQVCFE